MNVNVELLFCIVFIIMVIAVVVAIVIANKNDQISFLEEELKKIKETKKNNCAMLLNYGEIIHDLENQNRNLIKENGKLKELLFKNVSSYYRRNEDKDV